jgi:hypothetical protein
LEEKENRHAQRKRLYLNRASGGNRHHCGVDGDIAADIAARQKTGQGRCLPVKPKTVGHNLGDTSE